MPQLKKNPERNDVRKTDLWYTERITEECH